MENERNPHRFEGESDADFLLRTALDVAALTLRSGGEIHRVEETIRRICSAFGADHTEVFAIHSQIIASVRMKDGAYSSQVRRIYESDNRFARLDAVNRISRSLCLRKLTLEEAQEEIAKAKGITPYPAWMILIASACGAGGLSFLFGAGIRDALCAGLVGLLVTLLGGLIPKNGNAFLEMVLRSFAIGVLSRALVMVGAGLDAGKIIIGAIMLLVPGVSFGNAMRDLLGGDTLSGTLGIVRSILLAASIAFGLFVATAVTGGAVL